MKKLLFAFVLLFTIVNYGSSTEISNIFAHELEYGIITFTWDCDTSNIKTLMISVCKPDTDEYGTCYIRKFVTLQTQNIEQFTTVEGFKSTTDFIIINGNKSKVNSGIYDKCVNYDGTLKGGTYIINLIGINKNGTYNREYQSNVITIIGKNITTNNNVTNTDKGIVKCFFENRIYIIKDDKMFDIIGNVLK